MDPIKVFLVEDERIVREGLRDMIPWEQYGFVFAGEAQDGEVALPMVRRIRPDILITDIKMPFMDGLSLSRLVNRELPDTRIIILSGYDDFEYAQQAIDSTFSSLLQRQMQSKRSSRRKNGLKRNMIRRNICRPSHGRLESTRIIPGALFLRSWSAVH